MKAEELRIGNKIYCDDLDIETGKWHQKVIDVTYRDFYNLIEGNSIVNKWYEPIPITKDWLLKFGFKFKISSSSTMYYIGKNKVTHDYLFDLTWLNNPELIKAPDVPFYRNGGHNIYFLHQLQNLYHALTGLELSVS